MRKNLAPIALTLITCGSAAMAQSTVTVYGILDASVGRFKGAATGINVRDKADYRVNSGDMSASRLGFRGVEDLGSGLSATFDLSTFIRANNGAAGRNDAIGPPANVAADPFWSRAAWVGLTSRDWGRVRLGNISTLLWLTSINSNAFGDSTAFSPLDIVTFIGGPLSGGTGWTNSVFYDSPDMAGFTLAGAVSASQGQAGRNTSLRASYARGPAAASLVWQSVKKNPLTFADGTSPNNTKTWQLGGSYDFTVAKVFAHVGQIRNDGTEAAPLDIGYRIWEVSTSVPVGSGFILAGYAARKTSDSVGPVPATAPTGNKERKVLSVGYDHFVSKRTDLYAMVMNDKTVTNTLPAPPTSISASATNFSLGVRHRF